jgi:hypothetical protein
MDCGSLLPLFQGSPAAVSVSRSPKKPLGCRRRGSASARYHLGGFDGQQAGLPKAAAGCRSPCVEGKRTARVHEEEGKSPKIRILAPSSSLAELLIPARERAKGARRVSRTTREDVRTCQSLVWLSGISLDKLQCEHGCHPQGNGARLKSFGRRRCAWHLLMTVRARSFAHTRCRKA